MSNLQHFQKRENTSIVNSFHGWTGKTTLNANRQDWVITTMKRSSGTIYSIAQLVKGNSNGSFMFSLLQDQSIELLKINGKATEKAIRQAHNEALSKFDSLVESGELPESSVYEIKPGQLFRFDGYGLCMGLKYVCYAVESGDYGLKYKCVDLIEKCFRTVDHVKPVKEKFGIGIYYNEGEVMDQDELNNLVIDVAQLEKQRITDEETAKKEGIEAKSAAIARGSDIIKAIPESVKAMIIAELMEDDSDSMTDYFASHTTKVVILAFSTHTRDLFPEMRKAALNCPDTAYLSTEGEEHREKYSMGDGYYIGARRSGWRISKARLTTLEALQQAAGEGRYFVPVEIKQEVNPVSAAPGSIEIVEYSEKAFAVVGDTKPIKDILKNLGGKWNSHLKCGAGWIFSKKYYLVVSKAIGLA